MAFARLAMDSLILVSRCRAQLGGAKKSPGCEPGPLAGKEKGLRRALPRRRSPSSADAIDRESLRVDGCFSQYLILRWCGKLFDPATGQITDAAYSGRLDKFLNELVWMARALRYGREHLPGS